MQKKTTNDFIKKAKSVHGDKYDYSKVQYIDNKTKVLIICPEHGEFWQSPSNHLRGCNCKKCYNETRSSHKKLTTKEFIQKAKIKHGEKYDYTNTHYINARSDVTVICPIHGEFSVKAFRHITITNDKSHGITGGCPKCFNEKNKNGNNRRLSQDIFLNKVKLKHGNKYNYSEIEYINSRSKICVICNKHGRFYPIANNFLKGTGCPICNSSKIENDINKLLEENSILYIYQKKFDWLKDKMPLSLDFYLPHYNIAIECQGKQHFDENCFFQHENLNDRIKKDILKNKLCNDHGIKIFYFANYKFDFPYEVITDKNILLNSIINYKDR